MLDSMLSMPEILIGAGLHIRLQVAKTKGGTDLSEAWQLLTSFCLQGQLFRTAASARHVQIAAP